jgi:hypothetical protein
MADETYFITKVKDHLKPDSRRLDDVAIASMVVSAVAEYSQDHPNFKQANIASTSWSTSNYALPVPADWDPTFSFLVSIEFPSGSQEPVYLDGNSYMIYRIGTGNAATDYGIRYLGFSPNTADTSETSRVIYAVPHLVDGTTSTIPSNHQVGVGFLAASLAARALAGSYNSLSHTAEGLALSDFTAKAVQYNEMAVTFREQYNETIGKEGIQGPAAGFAVQDQDLLNSWGGDFLAHPAKWR